MNEQYFETDHIVLDQPDDYNITAKYSEGFVLTRLSKGEMIQTRSLRIDLNEFEFNSENRRVLKKNSELLVKFEDLPLKNYSWEIHKLGKDFYSNKFGDGTMSASKVKEMFQDTDKSNMNGVLKYTNNNNTIGYCLCYTNSSMIHYAYPFYNLDIESKNLGMGMILKALEWSLGNNKKHFYLGSVTTKSSLYKLQFNNLEWWDNDLRGWNSDIGVLKGMVNSSTDIA